MRWIRNDNISMLPNKSGLYAIYDKRDNRLLYFGETVNLYNRMKNPGGEHPGYRQVRYDVGTENIYIKYRVTEKLHLEKLFIKKLCPPYNLQYNCKRKIKRSKMIDRKGHKKDWSCIGGNI